MKAILEDSLSALACGLVILLLSILWILALALIQKVVGTTLEVPPYTIQQAIDSSSTRDSILIHTGTYEGNLSAQDKNFTMIGNGTVTISGKVHANSCEITFQNLSFTNAIHQPMPGLSAGWSDITIRNCRFHDLYGSMELAGYLYRCSGGISGATFENLTFEPCGNGYESGGAVTLYHCDNFFISNSIFRNCILFDEAALNVVNNPYESVTIQGCTFENLVNTGDGAAAVFVLGCYSVLISNTFQNCAGGGVGAVGVSFYGSGGSTPGFCLTIAQNTFSGNSARSGYNEVASAILGVGIGSFGGSINYNRFTGNIGQTIAHSELDGQHTWIAEDNWWGDASGPYHPYLNPEGRGDTVGFNIDFDPWEGQSEALSLTEGQLHATVSYYPNPTRRKIKVMILSPNSGRIEGKVFNILGQQVGSVFEDSCIAGKVINFLWTAENEMPSGIYFMHLSIVGEYYTFKFFLQR